MSRAASVFLFVLSAAGFAAEPVEFSVGSFTFQRPQGWNWIPVSAGMRKAQLSVPVGNGGDPAEVTFFHFGPGQGGSVQANVDRWLKQFSGGASDFKTEKIGETEVTFVKAFGIFSSGMPGGPATPKEGFALRGAILESSEGDVYVKMTGPEKTVKAAQPDFIKMVEAGARR